MMWHELQKLVCSETAKKPPLNNRKKRTSRRATFFALLAGHSLRIIERIRDI